MSARVYRQFEDSVCVLAKVAYDSTSTGTPWHSIAFSGLYSSTDFFHTKMLEEFGTGRRAKGVLSLAIVSKFAVAALKDTSPGADGYDAICVGGHQGMSEGTVPTCITSRHNR